jgi:hypothetical protein
MARQLTTRVRIAVPGVLLLVGAGLVVGVTAGASAPSLPSVAPERLLGSAIRAVASHRPVSGRLLAHVDLGLPSLPDEGPRASNGGLGALFEAISGDHRVRVWRSADGLRIAELLSAAEVSLTVSREAGRADAWAWDSRSFTAIHLGPSPAPPAPPSPAALLDPFALARQLLASVGPSTRVGLGGTARVAGRNAYVLRIEPRTSATLIGRIDVSIDAATRIPLRVAVFARGAGSPALSLGFVSVSFDPIDRAIYRFVPPPGATVTDVGRVAAPAERAGAEGSGRGEGLGEHVRILRSDWTTVLAYRLPNSAVVADQGEATDLRGLLPFSGPLFSARLVDRGDHAWLLLGAVPQSGLIAAAPGLP